MASALLKEWFLVKAFFTRAYPYIDQHATMVSGVVALTLYGQDTPKLNPKYPYNWVRGYDLYTLKGWLLVKLSFHHSLSIHRPTCHSSSRLRGFTLLWLGYTKTEPKIPINMGRGYGLYTPGELLSSKCFFLQRSLLACGSVCYQRSRICGFNLPWIGDTESEPKLLKQLSSWLCKQSLKYPKNRVGC